jgi:hypothetical protein
MAQLPHRDSEVERRRGLRDATLLVRERDDLGHHLLPGRSGGLGRGNGTQMGRAIDLLVRVGDGLVDDRLGARLGPRQDA